MIIVPFYISTDDTIRVLENALATLPRFNGRVLVAAQGTKDAVSDFRKRVSSPNVITIESNTRLGKWPAVGRCLSKLNGDEQWIAVFDGDGAFSGADLPQIVAPIMADGVAHTIGKRSNVYLSSIDEFSVHTRIYVEAFFNTLTLLVLKLHETCEYHAFDIQCGFQAFSGTRVREIVSEDLPYYGGELALFHSTVSLRQRVVNVLVHDLKGGRSNYRVSEIVEQLLHLPFLRGVDHGTFTRAVQLVPELYPSWIDSVPAFEDEIRRVLKTASR